MDLDYRGFLSRLEIFCLFFELSYEGLDFGGRRRGLGEIRREREKGRFFFVLEGGGKDYRYRKDIFFLGWSFDGEKGGGRELEGYLYGFLRGVVS